MSATYLTDVELLCTECRQPIKARINTQQWIRVERISPDGECKSCYDKTRELERSGPKSAASAAGLSYDANARV